MFFDSVEEKIILKQKQEIENKEGILQEDEHKILFLFKITEIAADFANAFFGKFLQFPGGRLGVSAVPVQIVVKRYDWLLQTFNIICTVCLGQSAVKNHSAAGLRQIFHKFGYAVRIDFA